MSRQRDGELSPETQQRIRFGVGLVATAMYFFLHVVGWLSALVFIYLVLTGQWPW